MSERDRIAALVLLVPAVFIVTAIAGALFSGPVAEIVVGALGILLMVWVTLIVTDPHEEHDDG